MLRKTGSGAFENDLGDFISNTKRDIGIPDIMNSLPIREALWYIWTRGSLTKDTALVERIETLAWGFRSMQTNMNLISKGVCYDQCKRARCNLTSYYKNSRELRKRNERKDLLVGQLVKQIQLQNAQINYYKEKYNDNGI